MKNLTQDGHNQGIFPPKIRALFSNFWKRAGETSPPPPSSYAPAKNEMKVIYFVQFLMWKYIYSDSLLNSL